MGASGRTGLGIYGATGDTLAAADFNQRSYHGLATAKLLAQRLGGEGLYSGGATVIGDIADGTDYPAFEAVVLDDSGNAWPFRKTTATEMTFVDTSGACTAYLVIGQVSGVSPAMATGGLTDFTILVQLTATAAPAHSLALGAGNVTASAFTDWTPATTAWAAPGVELYHEGRLVRLFAPAANTDAARGTALEAAITAAAAGDRVVVPPGDYAPAAAMVLKAGMWLDLGAAAVTAPDAATDLFTADDADDITITGGKLIGGGSIAGGVYTDGSGIVITGTSERCHVRGVNLSGFKGGGVVLDGDYGSNAETANSIVDCRAAGCSFGFYIGASTEFNLILGCHATDCTVGFHVGSGNNRVIGCAATAVGVSSTVGCEVTGAGTSNEGHGVISGCTFCHLTEALAFRDVVALGMLVDGCTIYDGQITIDGSDLITLTGCQIGNVTISVVGSPTDRSILRGCVFPSGNPTISGTAAAYLRVEDCYGSDGRASSLNNAIALPIGADPPASPADGDLWYETDAGILWRYETATSAWYGPRMMIPLPLAVTTVTTDSMWIARLPMSDDYDWDIVEFCLATVAAGTADGSNYYAIDLRGLAADEASNATLTSLINVQATGTTVTRTAGTADLDTSSYASLAVIAFKVGSPSDLTLRAASVLVRAKRA